MTSMLILLFMYVGVIALQNVIRDPRQAARAAGLLAMVGVINVIIVKYSVEWVQTLHQGSTLKLVGESTINPAMKYPLLISMLGTWLLYAVNGTGASAHRSDVARAAQQVGAQAVEGRGAIVCISIALPISWPWGNTVFMSGAPTESARS